MLTKTLIFSFAILNIIFAMSLRNQLFLSMQQEECPIKYTVRTGDILFNIANKFNSTVEEISSLNNLSDPNFIRVGQTLKIPCKNETMPIAEVNRTRENRTEENMTEGNRFEGGLASGIFGAERLPSRNMSLENTTEGSMTGRNMTERENIINNSSS
jgi:LysM repeat protein